MTILSRSRFVAHTALALVLASVIVLTGHVSAANITQTANDAGGTSSFINAGTWSNGAPPSAGNTYSTGFILRGPADANSYTFGGDSLTINTGGRFLLKTTGTTQTLTVNNLILAGGIMDQATTNNDGFQSTVAGNISVTATSSLGALPGETLTISAKLAGASMLQIAGAGVNANGDNGTVVFTNLNNTSFTGGAMMSGTGVVALGADLALGTGNITLASGTLRLSGGATNNYLANFAALSLATGSTANLLFTGADQVGSLILGGVTQMPGTYSASTNPTFFSGTGSITVVPEPSSSALVIAVGALTVLGWKRRA